MSKVFKENVGEQGIQGIKGEQGIQGIKGDTGDSFFIKKSYPTILEMNADFNNPEIPENSFVIITSVDPDTDQDNGKVYIKTATEYKFQSVLRGLKGEKGDQGIQGVKGDQGIQGEQGVRGIQGIQGVQGLRGLQGKGVTLKGTVADEPALSLIALNNNPQVGDAYWTEDGVLWIWTDDPQQVVSPTFLRSPSLVGKQGVKGDIGERGLDGAQGVQGQQGIAGRSLTLKGTLNSEAELPVSAVVGDCYWVGTKLYTWTRNPKEGVAEGFLASPELKGAQGIRGEKGDKGDKGDTPTLSDATTTTKGVMQVGSGLDVVDGKVSVNVESITTNNVPISSSIDEYPDGTTSRRIVSSASDPDYILLADVVKQLISTDLINVSAGNYFRMYVYTTKNGITLQQKVEFYNNLLNNQFPVFELHRSTIGGVWSSWKAVVIENYGKGNPNSRVSAVYGAKYTDVETGISYVKKGAVNSINSTNWVTMGGKEYLFAGKSGAFQTVSTNDVLDINTVHNGTIPFNTTNKSFQLQAGRTYRITATMHPNHTANSNTSKNITYTMTPLTSNTSATTYVGRSYPPDSSGNGSSGAYDVIYTPSSTDNFVIRATTVNGADVQLGATQVSLIIQEL